MQRKNKTTMVMVSLLVAAIVFMLLFFIIYNVSCWISPPYFESENGEKLHVMPIGQAMLGIIFASIGSIISLIMCYRLIKRKVR
jgi:hypothetical protein